MVRKIFASFFSFIFVLVAVYFVATLIAIKTFSDSEFLSDDFYDASYSVFFFELTHSEEVLTAFGNVDEADIEKVFKGVLQPADIEGLVDGLIDQINTVKPSEGFYNYSLGFDFLKDRLDLLSENLANYYYDSLPVCADTAEFTVYAVEDLASITCVPEQLARKDFALAMRSYLDKELFSDFSHSFDFTLKASDSMKLPLGEYIAKWIGIFIFVGTGLLLALMLIIGLLIFRPWHKVFIAELRLIFWPSLSLTLVFAVLFFLPRLSLELGERYLLYKQVYDVTFLPIAKNVFIIVIPAMVASFVGTMFLRNYSNKIMNDPS